MGFQRRHHIIIFVLWLNLLQLKFCNCFNSVFFSINNTNNASLKKNNYLPKKKKKMNTSLFFIRTTRSQFQSPEFCMRSYRKHFYTTTSSSSLSLGASANGDKYDNKEEESMNTRNGSSSNNFKSLTQSLLQSSINRAIGTISDLSTTTKYEDTNVENLMETVITTRNSKNTQPNNYYDDTNNDKQCEQQENNVIKQDNQRQHQDKRQYLSNPAVTPTALAHSLWSQVVQPYTDTVIDATCGNGKDTLILANLLFPSTNEINNESSSILAIDQTRPQLIGIDIQRQACDNTKQLLTDNLPSSIVQNYIQILHSSHAPIPQPKSAESVGLICYNLGYLPGSGISNKQMSTKMITTIYSLADAALLIRVGGLISIMAYPGSSYLEYCSVKYFVEGLAMFTSKDDWREYVDSIPDDKVLLQTNKKSAQFDDEEDCDGQSSVRESVRVALERVISEGDLKQTWRVFDHRPMGRPMSPILFTAMRIK